MQMTRLLKGERKIAALEPSAREWIAEAVAALV
jgi:hypothetical protein